MHNRLQNQLIVVFAPTPDGLAGHDGADDDERARAALSASRRAYIEEVRSSSLSSSMTLPHLPRSILFSPFFPSAPSAPLPYLNKKICWNLIRSSSTLLSSI